MHRRNPAIERDETCDRSIRDDGRGDQQCIDSGVRQCLRFAELGDTDSQGSGGDLTASDLRALVGLGVGPQRDVLRASMRRHRCDVALQNIEVDDERRCSLRRPSGAPRRSAFSGRAGMLHLSRSAGRRLELGDNSLKQPIATDAIGSHDRPCAGAGFGLFCRNENLLFARPSRPHARAGIRARPPGAGG